MLLDNKKIKMTSLLHYAVKVKQDKMLTFSLTLIECLVRNDE